MAIRQISVFLENREGSLLRVLRMLADAGIDLRAMSVADTQNFGILRLIVRGHDTASSVLKKAGYAVSLNRVTAAEIPDRPGGLSEILDPIAEAGLNIEYAYAFLTPVHGKACVVLRVSDNDRAEAVLRERGIRALSAREGDESPL